MAAAEERASTVLIAGEAGVGKSRLVAEFAARVYDAGGVVAVGSCLELVDRAMPFGPVVQALRELFGSMDEPARRRSVVAHSALGSLLPELRSTTAFPSKTKARRSSSSCSVCSHGWVTGPRQ